MRNLVLLTLSLAAPAVAQDFIHYRLEEVCGNEAINLATGASALPQNGIIESTSAAPFRIAGAQGAGLAGGSSVAPAFYNRIRTGWTPSAQPFTGDLTMAVFLRQSAAASGFYIWGNSGGFRLFTNGIAGRGLYQRTILASGGNGINASVANDMYLPATTVDFQSLASAGWVHVAIVVNATALTADWYINGVSVLTLTGVTGAQINAAGEFTLGQYNTSNSDYDFDEFVMSNRAFSAAEILGLMNAPRGGSGRFTSGISSQCGSVGLGSINGAPSLGNLNHSLQITTTVPTHFFSLMFGTNKCSLGGVFQLPLDAGQLSPIAAGCQLLVDTNMGSISGIGTGNTSIAFPIPPLPQFSGMNLFGQAALIDLATLNVQASSGLAMSVGS